MMNGVAVVGAQYFSIKKEKRKRQRNKEKWIKKDEEYYRCD